MPTSSQTLYLNKNCKQVPPAVVARLLSEERSLYLNRTKNSKIIFEKTSNILPLGVPSSFQYYPPYPISIKSAQGAYLFDLDENKYLDLSMGFGALQIGHSHPQLIKDLTKTLEGGNLYVAPSDLSSKAAEVLSKRFNLEMVRFTNSGTESILYAIKVAKVFTQRNGLIKIEGGYHGGYDPSTVSTKPSLDLAGSEDSPNPVLTQGTTPGDVAVVPYNNPLALEKLLDENPNRFAALLIEPVLENIGIVLPDQDYLTKVRELTSKHGVLLIFDEVKTGLTASPNGAAPVFGVQPDLITLAKSIGGGIAVGAFGGKKEIMAKIVDQTATHFGTYNGNPLAMQAILTVDKILTPELISEAIARNNRTISHINSIIHSYQLPAHVLGFGTKGAVTWSPNQVRNYRDYKKIDFELAELNYLWNLNRGIITPPGLDDQWLISIQHNEKDTEYISQTFKTLAIALRSY